MTWSRAASRAASLGSCLDLCKNTRSPRFSLHTNTCVGKLDARNGPWRGRLWRELVRHLAIVRHVAHHVEVTDIQGHAPFKDRGGLGGASYGLDMV